MMTALSRRALLAGFAAGLALPAAAQDIPPSTLPRRFRPRTFHLRDYYAPDQILVDPNIFSLFWTLPDQMARRYFIGIARDGLYQPGTFRVGAKKEWPSWQPTARMIRRNPELYADYAAGLPGGGSNPLGARALYLYSGGRDSYLRIHGTNAPETIRTEVSSGCIRMDNAHVAELYELAPIGTPVTLFDFTPD
jgi:lipoprotein-anchoring transpeptidase ErfK/SrfK